MELFVLIFIGFVLIGVILKSLTEHDWPGGSKASSGRFAHDAGWLHTNQDTQIDNNHGDGGGCHCDPGCGCDAGGDLGMSDGGMSDGGMSDCGGSCGGDCGGS